MRCTNDVNSVTGKKCACKGANGKTLPGCASCIKGTGDGDVCTGCDSDRFSIGGKCPRHTECKGGKLPMGESCECAQPACHRCVITQGEATGGECLSCKKNQYLHDGACQKACPPGMAHTYKGGLTRFGRFCMEPFTCVRGAITNDGHPRHGKKCKCPNGCADCSFGAHPTDPLATCLKCTSNKYLHAGQCVATCPVGMTSYGLRKYGRECRTPTFVCEPAEVRSGACKCGKRCTSCEWRADNDAKAHVCTACKSGKPPSDGGC